MTEEQALDRARFIWQGEDVVVSLYPGGRGASVQVDNVWHKLDVHGHASCHTKCEDLEADAEHAASEVTVASFRQLVVEALAHFEADPQQDVLNVNEWCKTAKALLERSHAHA